MSTPVHQVFPLIEEIGAAYTGRGTSASNRNFTFHRPPSDDPTSILNYFRANLKYFALHEGFDSRRLTLPNGAWPHSGHAIKAEDYEWVTNSRSQTIMPVTPTDQPVVYDGIATRSPKYVLGVQGADCPSVFFYDSISKVIGLAHAGWRPLVRGVIAKVVDLMVELGAKKRNVVAHISPGAGDKYNVFNWDDAMEPQVRDVFVQAKRRDLLRDRSIRHEMTCEDIERLNSAVGRPISKGTSFKLSFLANRELERCGISPNNISRSSESTIVSRYPKATCANCAPFKYHSYRRERPNHGLSISVLFLKSDRMPLAL